MLPKIYFVFEASLGELNSTMWIKKYLNDPNTLSFMKTIPCLAFTFLFVLFYSCNNLKKQDLPTETTYENLQIEIEKPKYSKHLTIIGEWRLDSVVYTNNGIKSGATSPFTITTWSFTNNGEYIVTTKEDKLKLTLQDESQVTAQASKQQFQGKYQQKEQELITFIMGGKTKYHIKEKSDSLLLLQSQRSQVPPISEKDKDKLAKHYFTFIKTLPN